MVGVDRKQKCCLAAFAVLFENDADSMFVGKPSAQCGQFACCLVVGWSDVSIGQARQGTAWWEVRLLLVGVTGNYSADSSLVGKQKCCLVEAFSGRKVVVGLWSGSTGKDRRDFWSLVGSTGKDERMDRVGDGVRRCG